MKKAFFKDPDVQHRFDRDGYVVIDFTTPEVVAKPARKMALNPEGNNTTWRKTIAFFFGSASKPTKQRLYT